MNERKDLVKIKKINKKIKRLKTKRKNVKLSDRNDLARNIMENYPLIDYPEYDNTGYPVFPKKSDKSNKSSNKNDTTKTYLYRYKEFVQYYQIIDKRKYVYLDKKTYIKQHDSLNNVNDYKQEIQDTQKQLNDTKSTLSSTTDSLNKVKDELSNVKQQLKQAKSNNTQVTSKSNPQDNTESDIDSIVDNSNPFAKQNLSKTHEKLQQERQNNQDNNNNQ